MNIYFDLEGKKINGGTLPADIVTTLARPDIVLIDQSTTPTTVYLYELTVDYESANSGANQRKENRYASLVSDIEKNGFTCVNVNFEIGTRGFIDNRNKCALARARSTPEDIYPRANPSCPTSARNSPKSVFSAHSQYSRPGMNQSGSVRATYNHNLI